MQIAKVYLLTILVAIVHGVEAQPSKILWLGNSYTYVNDLPAMFRDLALSGGDSVVYDANTPGGYTLQGHATNPTSIQKIYSQKWDYVIVQAQSQEPSFSPSQVAQQTLPYARLLDSLITDNDSCTETIFYMTWGRKYSDASNCANYSPLCTFDGMQARLRESYIQMADDNHALTAPVGMAWARSWHTDTLLNLWSADNSHPNVAGTYLAACVFYGTIFKKSPAGLVYSPISASITNEYLQDIAYHTVFDSLENWNIGVFEPKAEFDFTGDEATKNFTFSNWSQNSSSYQWNFGDGTLSTTSGNHTYASEGTYTVSLVVFNDCGHSDTSTQTFTINGSSGINAYRGNNVQVSPNPARDFLFVEFSTSNSSQVEFSIADVSGRQINVLRDLFAEGKNETTIGINRLQSGVYFLSITENDISVTKKFVVSK